MRTWGSDVLAKMHRVYLPGPITGKPWVIDHPTGCVREDGVRCSVEVALGDPVAWAVQGEYFTLDGVNFDRCAWQPDRRLAMQGRRADEMMPLEGARVLGGSLVVDSPGPGTSAGLAVEERPRRPHWTETAERGAGSDHPLWGHLGEDPDGNLVLPAGRNHWVDVLNLRNPWHWPPYLRSRISRRIVWLDS